MVFSADIGHSWAGLGWAGGEEVGVEPVGRFWAGLQRFERLLPLLLQTVCTCWGGAVNGGFFPFQDGQHPAPLNWSWWSGLWSLEQGPFQL